jgi:putative DNA methylase
MFYRKKLIEVSLPLEAINQESAREKSIRHGHPSTLHLWWARRPLAACRAVLFASLVDDPSEHPDKFPTEEEQRKERQRLHDLIGRIENLETKNKSTQAVRGLVSWDDIKNPKIIEEAQKEIARCLAWEKGDEPPTKPEEVREYLRKYAPPVYDPFCGGGSIPLEAQRLGLEAHGSDLNPVAVLITKALIEIPPKFANQPPVNPEAQQKKNLNAWHGAQGLAEDVRYYGKWMRDEAQKRIGHLYPKVYLTPQPPLLKGEGEKERLEFSPDLQEKMTEIARKLRKQQTKSEAILWEALRNRKLEGKKFRRQHPIGKFVVDFYCDAERLIVEVDGSIHEQPEHQELDRQRQALLESLGLRFVRLSAKQVETDLASSLDTIRDAFLPSSPQPPSPLKGEGGVLPSPKRRGAGGEVKQATVIAWLWARTVKCPNPACGCQMPLVSTFQLSTKKGKEAWVEPIIDRSQQPPIVRFEVKTGIGKPPEPPKIGRGAKFRCLVCDQVANEKDIRAEFLAKRNNVQLMAIVAEGDRGRIYLPPNQQQLAIAMSAKPEWKPEEEMNQETSNLVSGRGYGITHWHEIFTSRQLVALTTFCDLVSEAREKIKEDAKAAGMSADSLSLNDGGTGATAYSDAIATYLGFAIDKGADYWNAICTWNSVAEKMGHTFARQAIPMTWDYAECCPFSDSSGNFSGAINWITKVIEISSCNNKGFAQQMDATTSDIYKKSIVVSTDPPYYDNIGYADLSDFFYVWLRRSIGSIYPDLFDTLLVPKAQELAATPYRFGGNKQKAKEFFEEGLSKTFKRMREMAHDGYPLTVYYAFKQTETEETGNNTNNVAIASTGWETMLEGLIKAGFTITGTLPMRTELSNRMIGNGKNALASSIALVCRPREENAPSTTRRQFLKELQKELPEAFLTLQQSNIAPVDLAQACIGPGMAVFSRYSKVLEADGTPMRVRTALQLINQILDEFLSEQEGAFDAETRWALTWFEQHQFNEGKYGDAETLSKAKNTSIKGIEVAGILKAKGGKVRLLKREEMFDRDEHKLKNENLQSNYWEIAQHLIYTLDRQGEMGAAKLLADLDDLGEIAKDLASRLYTICDRQGWTTEAIAYNSLVTSWSEISRLAAMEQQSEKMVQGALAV